MTLIGNLVTRFTADMTDLKAGVAQYGREIDVAEKKSEEFNRGLDRILITAGGVVAGVTAAVYAIKQFIDTATGFADSMQKASYATGLSVEELQRWKAAGLETDVTFEELAQTARMMTSRMGEVSDPGSEMSKTLKSIGVSAYDANGNLKSTNTLMWDIIHGLNRIPAGTERSSKALDIFGRSWYALAPMIENATQAEEAWNRADPFSDEKIARLDEYDDAMEKAGGTMEKWGVIIGDKLAPLITGIFIPAVDALDSAVKRMSEGWDWAQFQANKFFLWYEAKMSGNWELYNAFVTAGYGQKTPTGAQAPATTNKFLPDIASETEKRAKSAMDSITESVKEYTRALEKAADEKKRLYDMDKDYQREMSQVGWDVARARELTVRHGWEEEDQAGKVAEAQAAVGKSALGVGAASSRASGDLIIEIDGKVYKRLKGVVTLDDKELERQRIVAGVTS